MKTEGFICVDSLETVNIHYDIYGFVPTYIKGFTITIEVGYPKHVVEDSNSYLLWGGGSDRWGKGGWVSKLWVYKEG